jgi:hypothetical protein
MARMSLKQLPSQATALESRIDCDVKQRRFIQNNLCDGESRHRVIDIHAIVEIPLALIAGERFFTPRKSVGSFFDCKRLR